MYRPNNIKQNILKMLLLTSMLTLFTTYANATTVNMAPIISYLLSDTVTVTPQEIAIDKIKAYADNQENPAPTVQDYINVGVTGATAENIDDVNNLVTSLTASEVDTMTEIQAIVEIVINNTAPEPEVSTCISGPAQQLGQIKDSISGAGVTDATVTIAGCSTKTDVNGYYTLTNIAANDKEVVTFSAEGYYKNSTIIQIDKYNEGTTDLSPNYIEVKLDKYISYWDYDSQTVVSESHITIPAGIYINNDGSPYNGQVTAGLSYRTSAAKGTDTVFPGEYKGENTNGIIIPFVSYGFMVIDLTDVNGATLNVSKDIALTFEATEATENILPLWYYDYFQGLWIEEGYAELQADGTYRGDISHPGAWSLNQPIETDVGIYHGHILNEDGSPISDVRLYAVGENWIASDLSTDKDGMFEIEVIPGSSFQLAAYDYKNKYGANYDGVISAVASGEIVED